jgi:thioredoxin-related protein
MKRLLLFFAFTFPSMIAVAQTENLTFQDLSEVKNYSSNNEMNILMVFAGSDWCRPCIQFKKEVLESLEFQDFANENLVILYLDFPSKKKNKLSEEQTAHNESLAEKYNTGGAFPKILIFDSDEHLLGEIEYTNQRPNDFISQYQNLLNK